LAGFVWVIGDLFQQYAAKYVGISRGIPLSNTNQLWGLAWGILVFGEPGGTKVIGGSLLMALGAGAIALASASGAGHKRWPGGGGERALRRRSRLRRGGSRGTRHDCRAHAAPSDRLAARRNRYCRIRLVRICSARPCFARRVGMGGGADTGAGGVRGGGWRGA